MPFTCGAPYQGDDPSPRCILTWPHHDRLHEDGTGDRWAMDHRTDVEIRRQSND